MPSEPSYRRIAAVVTVVAAIVHFALGFVLQLMTYELFESYSEYPLPAISKPLFESFGFRPTAFLVYTTFWLWWPFLWAFIHTHFFYSENEVFGRVYIHRLILCMSFTALYASVYSILAATPRVILLADLSHQPAIIMRCIPIISRVIPLVFLVLTAKWTYRTCSAFRDRDGKFRITHKSEKTKYM